MSADYAMGKTWASQPTLVKQSTDLLEKSVSVEYVPGQVESCTLLYTACVNVWQLDPLTLE